MSTFWLAIAGAAADVVLVWLIWRARGRPLPARLEWMRAHRVTRWLVSLMEKPALAGL